MHTLAHTQACARSKRRVNLERVTSEPRVVRETVHGTERVTAGARVELDARDTLARVRVCDTYITI